MSTQRLKIPGWDSLATPLWDSAETAERLNVPVRTLDQWSYRGVGPRFYKVGRFRRYVPTDVESWLSTQVAGGGDAA